MSAAARVLAAQQEQRRRKLVVETLLADQSRKAASGRADKRCEKHLSTPSLNAEPNGSITAGAPALDPRPSGFLEVSPSKRRILATMQRLHPTAVYFTASLARPGAVGDTFALPRRWRRPLPWGPGAGGASSIRGDGSGGGGGGSAAVPRGPESHGISGGDCSFGLSSGGRSQQHARYMGAAVSAAAAAAPAYSTGHWEAYRRQREVADVAAEGVAGVPMGAPEEEAMTEQAAATEDTEATEEREISDEGVTDNVEIAMEEADTTEKEITTEEEEEDEEREEEKGEEEAGVGLRATDSRPWLEGGAPQGSQTAAAAPTTSGCEAQVSSEPVHPFDWFWMQLPDVEGMDDCGDEGCGLRDALLLLRSWLLTLQQHGMLDLEYDSAAVQRVLQALHDVNEVLERDMNCRDSSGRGEVSAERRVAAEGAEDARRDSRFLHDASSAEQLRLEQHTKELLDWLERQSQSLAAEVTAILHQGGEALPVPASRFVEVLRPGLLDAHPDTWRLLMQRLDAAQRRAPGCKLGNMEDALLVEAAECAVIGLSVLASQDVPLWQLRLASCIATGFYYVNASCQSDDCLLPRAIDVFHFLTEVPPFRYVTPDATLARKSSLMDLVWQAGHPVLLPARSAAERCDPQRQAHMAEALLHSMHQLLALHGLPGVTSALVDIMRAARSDPRCHRLRNRLYDTCVHRMAVYASYLPSSCGQFTGDEDWDEEDDLLPRDDDRLFFGEPRQRHSGGVDFDLAGGRVAVGGGGGAGDGMAQLYDAVVSAGYRPLGLQRIGPDVGPAQLLLNLLPLARIVSHTLARPGATTAVERGDAEAVAPSTLSYMVVGGAQLAITLMVLHGMQTHQLKNAQKMLVCRPWTLQSAPGGGAGDRAGQLGKLTQGVGRCGVLLTRVQLGFVPNIDGPAYQSNDFSLTRVTATTRLDKALKTVRQGMLDKKLGTCWVQGQGLEGIQKAVTIAAQVASDMEAAGMGVHVAVTALEGSGWEPFNIARRIGAGLHVMQGLLHSPDAAVGGNQHVQARIRELLPNLVSQLGELRRALEHGQRRERDSARTGPGAAAESGRAAQMILWGDDLVVKLRLVQTERDRPDVPVLPLRAAMPKQEMLGGVP